MTSLLSPAKETIQHIKKKHLLPKHHLLALRTSRALGKLECQLGYLTQIEARESDGFTLATLSGTINTRFLELQKIIETGKNKSQLHTWLNDFKAFYPLFKNQTGKSIEELKDKIQEAIELHNSLRTQENKRFLYAFLILFGSISLLIGIFMGFVILVTGAVILPNLINSSTLVVAVLLLTGAILLTLGVSGLSNSAKIFSLSEQKINFAKDFSEINPSAAYLALEKRLSKLIEFLN